MAPSKHGGGNQDVMLIGPGYLEGGASVDWSKVTASGLLGLDPAGKVLEGDGEPELSGACIHLGVRRSRPDAKVIFHTHTPYATALGCLQDPSLLMIHQNSCRCEKQTKNKLSVWRSLDNISGSKTGVPGTQDTSLQM